MDPIIARARDDKARACARESAAAFDRELPAQRIVVGWSLTTPTRGFLAA